MISSFDSTDEAIGKTIKSLCQELATFKADSPEFLTTVEAIAKLRASLNPVVQQIQE